MTSRYDGRMIALNGDEIYAEIFNRRAVGFVNQYTSPRLRYPTQEEMNSLTLISYSWKMGDKLYKVADQYYNDSTLWWVIAWFNKYPTEAAIKIGFTIQVPMPLERALQVLGA